MTLGLQVRGLAAAERGQGRTTSRAAGPEAWAGAGMGLGAGEAQAEGRQGKGSGERGSQTSHPDLWRPRCLRRRCTQTYFTTGEKETRAWTIRAGMTAPQAAGVIHTDFEKGFIRAETISFDDYVKFSGYNGAKENGSLRLEGKEYVVQEGDVMLFRFNV